MKHTIDTLALIVVSVLVGAVVVIDAFTREVRRMATTHDAATIILVLALGAFVIGVLTVAIPLAAVAGARWQGRGG